MKKQQQTRRTSLFTLAALVVVLMSNVQTGRAEEPDPRILWVADSSIGMIGDFTVHPNGNVYAFWYNNVYEIDGKTGKVISTFTIASNGGKSDISDDGKFLVTVGGPFTLTDLESKQSKIIDVNGSIESLSFLPNSHKFGTSSPGGGNSNNNSIIIYDIDKETTQTIASEEVVRNIAFSSDGRFMATAGVKEKSDGHYYTVFKLWDAQKLTFIKELKRYDNSNNDQNIIKFSPDSKTLCINSSADLLFFELNNFSFVKSIYKAGFYEFINDSLIVYSNVNEGNIKILNYFDYIDKSIIGYYYPYRNLLYSSSNKSIIFDYIDKTNPMKTYQKLVCFDFDKIMNVSDNPTLIDSLMIKYERGNISIMNISLFYSNYNLNIADLSGKIVFEQSINNLNNDTLNIKLNLTPGIYFFNLSNNSNSKTYKFLVTE